MVAKGVFVCLVGALCLVIGNMLPHDLWAPPRGAVQVPSEEACPSLSKLLSMSFEQLTAIDLATLNLACAEGLAGSEHLDVQFCLSTLDQWSKHVREETQRHLYRVTDPQYAEHYGHSEARFRVEMLVQVLQEDLGVHYNMVRVEKIDFKNSQDLFIHGLIGNSNGGTCVSMPVVYAAVARRLGYPVKLVEAKSHLFCRWDDGKKERFNFDASANGGVGFHDDAFYRNWPRAISDDEIARGQYLRSLSTSEEFAVFLAARGHNLLDNGHLHDAQIAYVHAHKLNPRSQDLFDFLRDAVHREETSVRSDSR